jgi:Outer membrane protein beta-barrel domain
MDIKKSLLCFSLFTALTPAFAEAEQPSYSFVDLGYLEVDLDESEIEPTGMFARGSLDLAENWFIFAGYAQADENAGGVDIDVEEFSVGAGFKTALSDTTSLYLAASYIAAEAEVDFPFGGSESFDEDGYGLDVGVRTMVTKRFELNGNVGYSDSGEDDAVDFGVGAVWYLWDNVGLLLEVSSDEDSNRQYMIGGRLSF